MAEGDNANLNTTNDSINAANTDAANIENEQNKAAASAAVDDEPQTSPNPSSTTEGPEDDKKAEAPQPQPDSSDKKNDKDKNKPGGEGWVGVLDSFSSVVESSIDKQKGHFNDGLENLQKAFKDQLKPTPDSPSPTKDNKPSAESTSAMDEASNSQTPDNTSAPGDDMDAAPPTLGDTGSQR